MTQRIAPNNQLPKQLRHKWVKDERGKHCEKCGSRINESLGSRYVETDKWGISENVDWYPRCYPHKKQITR